MPERYLWQNLAAWTAFARVADWQKNDSSVQAFAAFARGKDGGIPALFAAWTAAWPPATVAALAGDLLAYGDWLVRTGTWTRNEFLDIRAAEVEYQRVGGARLAARCQRGRLQHDVQLHAVYAPPRRAKRGAAGQMEFFNDN